MTGPHFGLNRSHESDQDGHITVEQRHRPLGLGPDLLKMSRHGQLLPGW